VEEDKTLLYQPEKAIRGIFGTERFIKITEARLKKY